MSDDNRTKALESALGLIEREYGTGSIMRLGDNKTIDIEEISTGSLGLDMALGIEAFQKVELLKFMVQKVLEKPPLLYKLLQVLKKDGICAFIDAEHAVDPVYAKNLGVDVDKLLISQPDAGEQALEIADTLVKSGAVDVLVIDSVAALVPKAELEGDMGDSHVGLQARLMSQALRKLTHFLNCKNKCNGYIY